LIDLLKEHYDVEVVLDESWLGKPYPDLSFIDESYIAVVFFQLLPPKSIIEKIKNENIIYFPMYDQSGRLGYDFWDDYSNLKVMNFSKTLHQKLKKWRIQSDYVQYFPEPQDYIPGKLNEVFFWQRLTKVNFNVISKLFGDGNFKIHIHKAVDPGQDFICPNQKAEKKFNITYSDWFETREQMWDLVKEKGIYVAPREYEGIGMSFLEAMAMGKAVIAVDNPTMNEYIQHGKNGFLFNLEKPILINFGEISKIQRQTHDFMRNGYNKWQRDKVKIVEFIKMV
jgi:glycosyltransferase involved in cell wall biosynthesis